MLTWPCTFILGVGLGSSSLKYEGLIVDLRIYLCRRLNYYVRMLMLKLCYDHVVMCNDYLLC